MPTTARAVVVASFLNLAAVVEYLIEENADPVFLCAGRGGLVGLDDVLCAGEAIAWLERRLGSRGGGRGRRGGTFPRPLELNDGAVAAQLLWAASMPIGPEALASTAAGRQLEAAGFGADIVACSRLDLHRVVPILEGRKIVVRNVGSEPGTSR